MLIKRLKYFLFVRKWFKRRQIIWISALLTVSSTHDVTLCFDDFFYKSHKIVFSYFLLHWEMARVTKKSRQIAIINFFYACRLFEPVQSGCRQLMVLTTKCQVICGDSPSLQHIVGYTVWHMVSRISELLNQDSSAK